MIRGAGLRKTAILLKEHYGKEASLQIETAEVPDIHEGDVLVHV